jgi:glutathione S-transferase
MSYELVIGNKNLSSWSMRPWLVMRHFAIPFDEHVVRLDQPESRAEIGALSPSGKVPCLRESGREVWDSLAICEFLADRHPELAIWPRDTDARALARCYAAEMHSGFPTLRTVWPMDIVTSDAGVTCPAGVRRDLDRIFELWQQARDNYGAGGSFLFGEFCSADAFFAPVVSRIRTYGPVDCGPTIKDYLTAIEELPSYGEWVEGARAEADAGWYG